MKIVVLAAARNEEARIDRFCRCYAWADKIIIADCGCEDLTVARGMCYENVAMPVCNLRVHLPGSQGWFSPPGEVLAALLGWARDEDADWIVSEDIDCVPNFSLRVDARIVISNLEQPVLLVPRLTLWGDSLWFPDVSRQRSLWAWRANWPVEPYDGNEHQLCFGNVPAPKDCARIDPPYCLLHYGWGPETVAQKLRFYRRLAGTQPLLAHPLKTCGRLVALPDWAHI